jgi:hypothetical protein
MYNILHVLTLREVDPKAFAAELRTATSALLGLVGVLIEPTQPGVYNGGDILLRLVFEDEIAAETALAAAEGDCLKALLADARVAHDDHVAFQGGLSGGASDGAGLYRVALFCANVVPDPQRLLAFRDQTVSMAGHIRTIRRWQLSQTNLAAGARPWTHVWEQEYADIEGLNGAYMLHPVHWAHVERWFDTEYPEHLVDPVLVHTFCEFSEPVIV